MAIQITRKEQQVLRNLKAIMAAEQTQTLTEKNLQDVDPGQDIVTCLLDKKVLLVEKDFTSDVEKIVLTKEPLQVIDDDPEIEQAWEDFRQVQGNGSMTKLYERNLKAEAATKKLEKLLYQKGRLTHLTNTDGSHMWVTEGKLQHWLRRGWKEASPAAVPIGLQA